VSRGARQVLAGANDAEPVPRLDWREVHLAEQARFVARCSERVRNRPISLLESSSVGPARETVIEDPSEERGARRYANGRGAIGVVEDDTTAGQLVDERGVCSVTARVSDRISSLLVGHDEEEARTHGRRPRERARCSGSASWTP